MSIAINDTQARQAITDHFQQTQEIAGDSASRSTVTIDDAAKQFSALLVNMMIDSMRSTLSNEDIAAKSGLQYDFFSDLLFQQYSEVIANSDALGLNQLITDSLSR